MKLSLVTCISQNYTSCYSLANLANYFFLFAQYNQRGHYGSRAVPTSYGPEHIGIEEVEEIKQLCNRIFNIENEIKRYKTLRNNLQDEDVVQLSLEELLQYGFE